MVKKWEDIAVVTSENIVGEEISETYGYVNATHLDYFLIFKGKVVERALDAAFSKLQFFAFKDGADAVINARTSLELQSQYFLFTRVNVFMEGTTVILRESE